MTNALTLFDIERSLVEVFDAALAAQESGQEPTDEQLALIYEYVQVAADKRDKVAAFLRTVEIREDEIDIEIKRLQYRKRALAAARERVENYVLHIMRTMGVKKLEGNFSTFSIYRHPASVAVEDENAVPLDYKRVSPTPPPVVDKIKVKEALIRGEEIAGVRLITDKESLRIK